MATLPQEFFIAQSNSGFTEPTLYALRSPQQINTTSQEKQDLSACLAELVKTVETYGVIYDELQKLCNPMGIRCERHTIAGTFNEIRKLLNEYQEMAESERRRRHEAEAFAQQMKKNLSLADAERAKAASLLREKQQQLVHETEIANKLDMNLRLALEQINSLKGTMLQEVNEAKKNATEAELAYSDEKAKVMQLEEARRQAEIACNEAVSALNQQLAICQHLEHENLQLRQQALQLEQENRQRQQDFDDFYKACEDICIEEDGLRAIMEIERKKRGLNGEPSTPVIQAASVTTSMNQTSADPIITPDQSEILPTVSFPTQHPEVNFSRRLLLPQPGCTKESIEASNAAPHICLQCHASRRERSVSSDMDGCPTQWHAKLCSYPRGNRHKTRMTFPYSVVSGPSILNQKSHMRFNGQHLRTGWSPGSSELAITSESSDSALADDHALDGSYGTRSYASSAAHVNSYDYGGSSTLGTTDDYDSVNGMDMRHGGDRMGLLQAVWKRRGAIIGSLKSGISNAAQTGAKMSKNVWAWSVVAAIAAGSVVRHGEGGFIGASDFSDSDDAADAPDADIEACAFQG